MNKYNDSYLLTNIDKKIKNKSQDINITVKELSDFIKEHDFYSKFESFKNIKNMIKDINKLDINELVNEINELVNNIDNDNNRYKSSDYDYIESKLREIVYNTKNTDR